MTLDMGLLATVDRCGPAAKRPAVSRFSATIPTEASAFFEKIPV